MADASKRDALLAAVTARVESLMQSGDPATAAAPAALEELTALCAVTDTETDLDAAQAAGVLYAYRAQATRDPDEQAKALVEAMSLLRVVFRAGEGIVPDFLARIFQDNPGLLAPDWYKALAADAERLARSAGDSVTRLSIVIAMQRKAATMAPESSQLRQDYRSNLGLFLRSRHEMTKSVSDLEEALAIAQECVKRSGWSGLNRAPQLFNLSLAYRDRFEMTKAQEDMDQWLRYAREALDAADASSRGRTTFVSNLVKALRAKHGVTPGDSMDELIALLRRETAEDAQPRPEWIDLTAALITRFEDRGAIEDLDEGIARLRRLADSGDVPDEERAGCLSNLGIALMMRFDTQGATADLEEGFEACRKAVQAAPKDSPERPMYNSNLGLLALTRAQRNLEAGELLEAAVRAARAALEATPQCAMYATNLATVLMERFRRAHTDLSDLDEAVSLCQRAVDAGAGSEYASRSRLNAAVAQQRRYEITGSQADLEDAIARYRQALASLPPETPSRAMGLLGLGEALMARNGPGDLEASIAASEEAALSPAAAMSFRFQAANQWAAAAGMRADWQTACRAYSEAIGLLKFVAPGTLGRRDQERALASATGLSSRAVAAYLQMGDVEGALDAFERSRGTLLARQIQSHSEIRALATAHPELAKDYQETRERLLALEDQSSAGALTPLTNRSAPSRRPAAIGRERASLLQRMETSLATIRALDGFHDFESTELARPRYVPEAGRPVVVLNASAARIDALLVEQGGVRLLPLPEASLEQLEKQAMLLWGAVEDAHSDFTGLGTPVLAEYAIDGALMWLWDAVVEPVMSALGVNGRPQGDDGWPRICWCPSGFLSFLPLHAAGYHQTRAEAVPRTAMDRVISTYTPTLRMLASCAQGGGRPTACDLLVVAMPRTPGAADLPGVAVEARFLNGLFGERARLLGAVDGRPPATVEEVRKALPESRWAHFGCHALSDFLDPASGGLLLDDGRDRPLSVDDLMQMDLEGVEMAFLSACSTARPAPAVLEEAVHLASAFRVAGYPRVVATLWEVGDRAAAYVTEHFYRSLAEDHDRADAAAACLHSAVRDLRETVPDRPSQWAAHIHVGP